MTTVQPRTRNAATVAKQTVRQRLHAVLQILHSVTPKTHTSKTLHQLRIACRRAEAALRLCRDEGQSRSCQWLRKQLSGLRRACNQARDDDVFLKWLKQQPEREIMRQFRREVARDRRDAIPRILQRVEWLTDGRRFERHAQRLLRSLGKGLRAKRTPRAFGTRLFRELQRFVQALPTTSGDVAALHRLRIEAKRLRYSVEVVTEIWSSVDVTELQELLAALQERFGQLHDEVVREQRLAKLLARLPDRPRPRVPQRSDGAQTRREKTVWKWWQTCPVERILADATAEIVTLIRK
ncbi:MAG TPA: CHAD domain-containing protein [Planctomycetaceae bacterium]|nr:CHAD domain-containing protein [Planctomycetaceae bacterium]